MKEKNIKEISQKMKELQYVIYDRRENKYGRDKKILYKTNSFLELENFIKQKGVI